MALRTSSLVAEPALIGKLIVTLDGTSGCKVVVHVYGHFVVYI